MSNDATHSDAATSRGQASEGGLLVELWRSVARSADLATLTRIVSTHSEAASLIEQLQVLRIDPSSPLHQELPALLEAGSPSVLSVDEFGLGDLYRPSSPTRAVLGALLHNQGVPSGLLLAESLVDPARSAALLAELIEPFEAALATRPVPRAEAEGPTEARRSDSKAVGPTHPVIIGARSGLRSVMEQIELVSSTDATVLITGETGTGKELVARAVHVRSRRAAGPFLMVNCGSIPTELVDSELFGHERGSFTGAIASRQGWFERAHGGTLFLDEVGDLPAAAQVRLLRVLQDGSFERVGGEEERKVDVRLIAATHRDMSLLISDGTFREDLWYRLSIFPISIPPLRSRRGDIAALANHFARDAGQRLHGSRLSIDPDDLRLLERQPWPGNVRELSAVIERAVILGNGQAVDVQSALGRPPTTRKDGSGDSTEGALLAANRQAIIGALERSLGRIEGPFGAAAALGINPHTLRARMRKMGLDWSRFRQST